MKGCRPGYSSFTYNSQGDYHCSLCSGGTHYSFGDSQCKVCPVYEQEATVKKCTQLNGQALTVLNGFWVLPNTTLESPSLLACPTSFGCLNFTCEHKCTQASKNACSYECSSAFTNRSFSNVQGYGYGFCEEGFEGLFCSSCSQGKFKSMNNDKCVSCSLPKSWKVILVTLIFPVCTLLLVLLGRFLAISSLMVFSLNLLYILQPFECPFYAEISLVICNILFILNARVDENERISGSLKVMLFYLQISSFFPNANVWEGTSTVFVNRLRKITSFQLQKDNLSCFLPIFRSSELASFLFNILLPPFCLLLILLLFFLQQKLSPKFESRFRKKPKKYRRLTESSSQEYLRSFLQEQEPFFEEASQQTRQKDIRHDLKRVALFSVYIFNAQLLSSIFSILNCTSAQGSEDQVKFVYAYPWITCESRDPRTSQYGVLFILGVSFAVTYLLFIFSSLIILIRHNRGVRKRIEEEEVEEGEDKSISTWFSFFYDHFKKEFYFFEFFWLLKICLIVAFLNLLSFDYYIQKFTAMVQLLPLFALSHFSNFYTFFFVSLEGNCHFLSYA